MTAQILTIGDEILIGQIVDTNSAWMGQQLNLYGIRVTGKSSVGDVREEILYALDIAAQRADVIIITGGLGPTKDDITKKVLAEKFQSEMVFHPETYERIEGYFKKIGKPTPHTMQLQATLPHNAVVLTNKVGTAPGMWFESGNKVFISLPGVPYEMEYLMLQEVIPRLVARFQSRPIAHRTLLTACEGETNIARRIEAFEDALPPNIKLAYLPGLGQVRLRLTGIWEGAVTPDADAQLAALLDAKKNELAQLLPDILYGYETETLQEVIGKILLEKQFKICTAESCTGGYIAHLLTLVPGSSAYFEGSAVTYSYEMKQKMLGVHPETLMKFGAVSQQTVEEMAKGAQRVCGAGVALSVSGIAGPGGATDDKPVGTVWMAVAIREKIWTQKLTFGRDRQKNIHLTGVYGLAFLRKCLLEN